ncbi:MAG: hypothetical protein LBK68_08135 [Candidatus Margulisbacteria bacterium]|jgi:hypothetical protein|nr:hypothetical protein [Candidatus Margulisiibacteriota bacterium]
MRKGKIVLWSGIVLLCMFSQLFGFATLFANGGDNIEFTTNVSGVTVYKNGRPFTVINETNKAIKIQREKGEVVLTFRKDGYEDNYVALERSIAGAFWLNFIVGAIWGASSDLGTTGTASSLLDSAFTGNSMEYSPNSYYVQMVKKS